MNVVAADLILLCLGSARSMHALSCCCHFYCVLLDHTWLFNLLSLSCIRMWNKAVLGIRPGPFSCLATEWHLFFRFFFPSLQLRARHNYFHQGPRTLSGKKRSKTQFQHLSGNVSVLLFLSVLLFKELHWCQKLREMFMNIQGTIKLTKKMNIFSCPKTLPRSSSFFSPFSIKHQI